MIEAKFIVNVGNVPTEVCAYLPTPELAELTKLAGWDISDLCRITDSCGASRWLEARLLVKTEDLPTLYAGLFTVPWEQRVQLKWKTDNVSVGVAKVFLAAPQPIFAAPNSPSVVLVVARDLRFFPANYRDEGIYQGLFEYTRAMSSDGRWGLGQYPTGQITEQEFTDFRQRLIEEYKKPSLLNIDDAGVYPPDLRHRFDDMLFQRDSSLGLVLDTVLSGTGNALVRVPNTGNYKIINLNPSTTSGFLVNGGNIEARAMAGGTQSTGVAGGATSLQQMWNNWPALGMGPSFNWANWPFEELKIARPANYVEGLTDWWSRSVASIDRLNWTVRDNCVDTNIIATNQGATRYSVSLAESKPMSAKSSANLLQFGLNEFDQIDGPAGWDLSQHNDAVKTLFLAHRKQYFGRVMCAGWVHAPQQTSVSVAGLSKTTWTVGFQNNELVAVTVFENDIDDWIIGPNGKCVSNTSDLVMGRGFAECRRLWNNATVVNVPIPNTRIFPAKILDSESAGAPWRWRYLWEEVEPQGLDSTAAIYQPATSYSRTSSTHGKAVNLCEAGNEFVGAGNPANVIATGARQSDYPNAVISPEPICTGTIVMMCEQYLSLNNDVNNESNRNKTRCWFSIPNAIRVICE